MSTTDPIEARRRRSAARQRRPGSLAMLVIGLLIVFLGGVAEARGLYGFAEFPADGQADGPPVAIVGMVVGVPVILVGLFTSLGGARRYTGKLIGFPGIGPGSVLVTGGAVGAWWGWSSVSATGPWWLIPAAPTSLAVLSVLLGMTSRIRRRRRATDLETLVTTGRIVTGTITDIPSIDPSSGGLLGTVTVSFTDLSGAERWVQKVGQWRRHELPRAGDLAEVLFDPADPGDTRRIWVGPAGSRSAADFTRWTG